MLVVVVRDCVLQALASSFVVSVMVRVFCGGVVSLLSGVRKDLLGVLGDLHLWCGFGRGIGSRC